MFDISPELWTVIGGLIGVLITNLVQSRKNRTDAFTALVDNLQEEVKRLRGEVDDLRDKYTASLDQIYLVQVEAQKLQERARLHISLSTAYVFQLRTHINTNLGPPAPEIPEDLLALMDTHKYMAGNEEI